ncbi:uncharacterized protein LOC664501 [Tribolium castaneum]|uniref:Uncharacterized protein n=1 Tax=Tribolium castaneum TaxID=7070 RepID=D6WRM3_TRICA|nr:PREDICTED: uncharacterized protein LOC664501 [Tribolium castaneum]EFA05972.1 hypothetical protein TcasGA2_TC008796 [Tribolium castaneum]|eukprot:XP_008195990.1 PREDICTED: uncharacterized protein LOC664501 [Tribolium castaneum]
MALYLSRFYVSSSRFISLLTLTRVLPQFYSKFEADVIDDFTTQLMQSKISKWESKKRQNQALLENIPKSDDTHLGEISVENMGSDQLGFLFQNAIDSNDTKAVKNLINLCIQHNKSPTVNTIVNVLSICGASGDKETISQIQELCKTHHPTALEDNSNFRHYLAKAIWTKGDISKALEMFENVYRENPFLRRSIRLMLKYLISDLITNGSEAALANTIAFSERIHRDFQDVSPLTCVWQACFLSEWFTDQSVALELLEKHNGLCKSVINRIPYVVFVSLKCHRTEVVYRLLEILLKFKMKQQYSNVLESLLEYQFRYGDWNQCSEIIRWAVDNDVALPKTHHIKLINSKLNKKMKTPFAQLEQESGEKPKWKL